jgi:sugar O-acyltransferase (sialic acid O-acetyltransferase NeuD family)
MSNPIKNIVIVGAGGLGKETAVLINQINQHQPTWRLLGFYDDGVSTGTTIASVPVLGTIAQLNQQQELNVVIAIGDPAIKEKIVNRITNTAIVYPVLIHPKAVVGDNIMVGEGSIITAGCVLTIDSNIGKHVLINLNATIGHDVTVGEYSSIMPGAHISGFVTMGKAVFIGTGAAVLQHLSIAPHSIVGAGAVVNKSITETATVVGVPARILLPKLN